MSVSSNGCRWSFALVPKEKTNDKIAKGIFGFTPIGLLVNTADKVAHEDDQAEQKIKAYNEQIQQKIDSIKKTCNIQ